jgi:hypothetical protein
MSVSPFFDTNVLIYAFRDGDRRNQISRKLLGEGGVTGVQVLNEFVAIARRKLGFSWEEVLESLAAIRVLCASVAPPTLETHFRCLGDRGGDRGGLKHAFTRKTCEMAKESKLLPSAIRSQARDRGKVVLSVPAIRW